MIETFLALLPDALSSGPWWLVNWTANMALPLGRREAWTWQTAELVMRHWQQDTEVVDETTRWGRVYLSRPDLVIPEGFARPEPQGEVERFLCQTRAKQRNNEKWLTRAVAYVALYVATGMAPPEQGDTGSGEQPGTGAPETRGDEYHANAAL